MKLTNDEKVIEKFEEVLAEFGISKDNISYSLEDTNYFSKAIVVDFDDSDGDLVDKLDVEMFGYGVDVVSSNTVTRCDNCNNIVFDGALENDGVFINSGFYCNDCIMDRKNNSIREYYLDVCAFEDENNIYLFKALKENTFTEEELNSLGYTNISYGEYGLHFKETDMAPIQLFKQEKSDKYEKYVFLITYNNPYEVGFELYGKKKLV